MADPKRSSQVFLCHASTDKPLVRKLYKRLIADGIDAWLDEERLLPGQNFPLEIQKAVRESVAVIVCLTKNSVSKEGYVHREIKLALDIANEKPEGEIFIIPARFEECNVPESLKTLHWADLFKQGGYERLRDALIKTIPVIHRPLHPEPLFASMEILATGGKVTSQEILQIAHLIGQQIILRRHILLNNGSDGVDKATAEGALSACRAMGMDPNIMIQVIRPQKSRVPSYNFGNLQIIGKDFDERHFFIIQKSNAIILLGGGDGTRKIARRAQLLQKPIIPIGIGASSETAVQLWHEMMGEYMGDLPFIPINKDELQKIGPNQNDFEKVTLSAVLIAEKLHQTQIAK
jgi:predicted Rossmann-fold nucleotide-binding protein